MYFINKNIDKDEAKIGVVLSVLVSLCIGITWLSTRHVESSKRLEDLAQQEAAFHKSVEKSYAMPQDADLNMDGVPDLVLTLGDGSKVPLYGFGQLDNGSPASYRPSSFMKVHFPDSPINYESIDARLNQQ